LEVIGIDPVKDPSAFIPFCPLKNVDQEFPPTLLLHGTNDNDVPFEQSKLMAYAMERKRVPHELIVIRDGEHGFDYKWEDPQVQAAFRKVLAFLETHLQNSGNSK
jgi:dipeptidyl aminopeptidase/acylaminoacyl peptidase